MWWRDGRSLCRRSVASCRTLLPWVTRIWLLLGGTMLFLLLGLTVRTRLSQELEGNGIYSQIFSSSSAKPSADPRRLPDTSGKMILPGCPSTPPGLLGKLEVKENVTVAEAEAQASKDVKTGGFWWPKDCEARWSVAIVIPYRDRADQVGPFLHHMHGFLQRQQLNYSIYFVEQAGKDLFNRARLLNVGYLEALKEGPWDCYAFHDVDMLPENDYHLYHCSPQPRHLAVAASNNKYRLQYSKYYGGACLMTAPHIQRVNGWSNIYWGWGGEDDDMYRRIVFTDMAVWRYPAYVARYKTLSHKAPIVNELRYETVQRNTGRYPHDGLNTLQYTVLKTTRYPLYTHLLVDIGSRNEPSPSPDPKLHSESPSPRSTSQKDIHSKNKS